MDFWEPGPDGEMESPAARVARGAFAFPRFRFGEVVEDFPWCPRWWFAFGTATILDGLRPEVAFLRLRQFRDAGALRDVAGEPPWTAALWEGMTVVDFLEMEQRERLDERRKEELEAEHQRRLDEMEGIRRGH